MKIFLNYVSKMTDTRQEKSSAQGDEYLYACLFGNAGNCR